MSQWKKDDSAANSVFWAPALFNQVANSTTQAALFGNTTGNNVVTGMTVAQVGVDDAEIKAARTAGVARPAHAGWNLRKTGSGGRAGRISYECLVALSSMTGDASDDALLADYAISFSLSPSDQSVNAIANAAVQATFAATAFSTPTGATLAYFWQKWNGSAFANLSNAGAYANVDTASMLVNANTAANGEVYRLGVSGNGGSVGYSSNAMLVLGAYTLLVDTQPSNASINAASAANVATFTVIANSTPTGATRTYFWQKWNGSAWANLTNAGAYSNVTTVTLSVLANTASNAEIYRVGVATGNVATNSPLYSGNAMLIKT